MLLTSSLRTESDYKYNCRVKIYPNGTQKITVFSRGIFNPDGYALLGIEDKPKRERSEVSTVRSDSIKRSKEKVFDIAYANVDDWKYFVTLTLSADKVERSDPKEISKKFKNFLCHAVNRKDLKYIIVPEYHSDNKSIHFHGLINECGFKFVDSGIRDKKGRVVYNIPDWSFGFTTATKIENPEAACKYTTKYLSKDIENRPLSNFYYAGGHGLKRNVETFYTNVIFDDVDSPALDVPNTNFKVKYVTVGLL